MEPLEASHDASSDASFDAAPDAPGGIAARLASTVRIDEVVEAAIRESAALGFGAVWLAALDQSTSTLTTLRTLIDGVDVTGESPGLSIRDMRLPSAASLRDRRMISIANPDALRVIEYDGDGVPSDGFALPRLIYDRLRGHPFAVGPLLDSRGEPVGTLGLSSYLGRQPIPDAIFAHGSVRTFIDHLGLALERALRVRQLDDSLGQARASLASDAQLKSISMLAASIAHDLNNLSGVALLAVEVGARSPDDAFRVMPQLDRASRASRALVSRLQRITRPPSGELETAQPSEIVDDILTMLRPLLRDRAIEVDVELAAVPAVRCDGLVLQRVVLNLLLNAQDALAGVAADRRRIRVRVHGDGAVVRLTVADTGPGIPASVLERLFQPFSSTKGGAHVGLGLSSARTSLEAFGARIEARNAPGGGAVFEIALVAATPGAAVTVPAAAPVRPAAADLTGRGKILAVDDDADVVYIIQAFLNPLGYEVATATDAARALDAASSEGFDLVLCDIGMPGRSGLDMPRALRERGYGGKLILMTGWDSYALSADPRIAECDTLLKKPFGGPELVDAISAVLATTTG